jgi:hypothetical protein
MVWRIRKQVLWLFVHCVLFSALFLAAASWLIVMLGVATFNGGKYYLEIMAERHAKKQERKRPEVEFVISSSFARFLSFVVFILVAVLGYRYMMTSVLQIR